LRAVLREELWIWLMKMNRFIRFCVVPWERWAPSAASLLRRAVNYVSGSRLSVRQRARRLGSAWSLVGDLLIFSILWMSFSFLCSD
jgi:hypothetical protein